MSTPVPDPIQAAVDDALEWAADYAETVAEQFEWAASRLRWQPEALKLLEEQRLLAQTVPGIH